MTHPGKPFPRRVSAGEEAKEMLTVDTIAKVRLALAKGRSIRNIAKSMHLSRHTVRKIQRGNATEFSYTRTKVIYPVLGDFLPLLTELLEKESCLPAGKRRQARQIFEEMQRAGFPGSYDSVRRYMKKWRTRDTSAQPAYVPLVFGRGEAFQFDWSEESVELGGSCIKVQVAHLRLCHSRMSFCMAFTRQGAEMVLQAHIKGHDFFGGLCERGIYDNLKTVVSVIHRGKERTYNRRFLQLASHYLFEPEACTPASGWEKGRVENQVKVLRKRFFTPRPRFEGLEELNAHLEEQCRAEARNRRHPDFPDKTIWDVFQDERPFLRRQESAFDGYSLDERRTNALCLVSFDRNHYSVPCEYAGKAVGVRIYADRLVFTSGGESIAEHRREFGKGRHSFNPMHYLPLLERKPGILRNGRPFVEWALPAPINAVREHLRHYPDWDRQMAGILAAIPVHGAETVAVACETALEQGVISRATVLNALSRLTEDVSASDLEPPASLALCEPPRADCARYDQLLEAGRVA